MDVSRRNFLVRSGWIGAGVTVLGVSSCAVMPALPTFGKSSVSDIKTWVQMLPDGRVRFLLPRAEMGQGISTGLSQVVAEELNLPLSRIDFLYQDTASMAPCQMTVGSQSVENYFLLTAQSAARLRDALRERAAIKTHVAPDSLKEVEGGFLTLESQRIDYPDLIDELESPVLGLDDSIEPILRSQRKKNDLRVLGKMTLPINIEEIVRGTEVYSRDVTLPGMLFGALARPPQIGANLERFDRSAAQKSSGVVAVVEHRGQVGVVAKTPMQAQSAIAALNAQWTALTDNELESIQQRLDVDLAIEGNDFDHGLVDEGSISKGRSAADMTISVRFDSPMVAHAAMEPRCGVATCTTEANGVESCEIWAGSQDPWLIQGVAAKSMGIRKSNVTVHNCRVGGAFGGRVLCQAAIEAAWLSQAVKQPVKVQWSREEEFRHNYFGPGYSTRISAGLDTEGKIVFWDHQALGAPIITSSPFIPSYLHWAANLVPDPGTKRGMLGPYAIPNKRVRFADVRGAIPTGPWRGLGAAPNAFAVESVMDELAQLAGTDPITFRLNHLGDAGLIHCLTRLRDRLGSNLHAYGIATTIYKEVTSVAVAAKVAITANQVSVTELICIHDCGRVLSPDQVRAQIEGCMVWGIGMALHEHFQIEAGSAATDNFDRYTIPRNGDVPEISIELVESDRPATGAGEAAFAPVAAAIANAVQLVANQRMRQLPIRLAEGGNS